jgi:hypothetical protein
MLNGKALGASCLRLAIFVLALASAVAALAAEGRVPVFAAGTAIVADGKYIVTRNISGFGAGCPGPLVSIAVPGAPPAGKVDLDLNGMTLDNTGCGFPVISVTTPADQVAIHNGTLKGGTASIDIPVSGAGPLLQLKVEGVRSLAAAGPHLHLSDVVSAVIRRSEITGGALGGAEAILWDGIGAPGGGTIADNVIRATTAGIVAFPPANNLGILNNRIEGILRGCGALPPAPIGTAIFLTGGAAALVSENTIEKICAEGISFRSMRKSKIYDNLVAGCGSNGIHLDAATRDVLVVNNVSGGNGFPFPPGDGLLVEGLQNLIDRNVLNDNATFGLRAGDRGHVPTPPDAPQIPRSLLEAIEVVDQDHRVEQHALTTHAGSSPGTSGRRRASMHPRSDAAARPAPTASGRLAGEGDVPPCESTRSWARPPPLRARPANACRHLRVRPRSGPFRTPISAAQL